MQGLCTCQEGNEDLQGSKDTHSLPQEIQAQRLLLRKDKRVFFNLFSLVDFPIEGLDLTDYLVNEDLPEAYFKKES